MLSHQPGHPERAIVFLHPNDPKRSLDSFPGVVTLSGFHAVRDDLVRLGWLVREYDGTYRAPKDRLDQFRRRHPDVVAMYGVTMTAARYGMRVTVHIEQAHTDTLGVENWHAVGTIANMDDYDPGQFKEPQYDLAITLLCELARHHL